MKTWFITGAARGFGALVTERALAQGDNVVATARNPKAITDRFGEHPNLLAVALDVSDEAQAHSAAEALAHLPRTTHRLLIAHQAGADGRAQPLGERDHHGRRTGSELSQRRAGGDRGVPEPRAVEVHRETGLCGGLPDGAEPLDWRHHTARPVVGVLRAHE